MAKFEKGNSGKPKGAMNKTTRDLRLFITDFLNEKTPEISNLWDKLEDREKLSLYLHLCKLVLPKTTEDEPRGNGIKNSIIVNLGSGIKPIEWVKSNTVE